MVFQSYALFLHLTVEENIVFGLNVRRLPAPERKRRLEPVAELVGLQEQLERKPNQVWRKCVETSPLGGIARRRSVILFCGCA